MASGKTLQSTIELSGVLSPSLQAAINSAVGKLSDMETETLESADAASRLVAEMSAQEDVLKTLQKAYAGYVANGEESSDKAQELANKIRTVSGELEENRGTLQAAERAANSLTDTQADAADAYTRLEKKIESQQNELSDLRRQYANVTLEQGKNSDEAKELESKIGSLSKELAKNERSLREVGDAAEEAGRKAENSGEGYTVLKNVLANLVTKGIDLAVEGMQKLFDAYKEYDAGADTVITATGATGEAAEGLAKAYAAVSQSVVGDFSEIGGALGEINTRFGFTDKELEESTTQFMKFADITGTDAVSAVQLVSRAMGDAGIDSSEYSSILDSLALAAQASGISIDSLSENLTKYGAPMRALGFDTQESIALFSQWEKAGVNTEIAFSGMKKAISNWAKDGKDSRQEFQKTLDQIAACPDIASATSKAIEVFGAKAGPDLADAIQGGRFEYSQFLGLLEGSQGTVSETYEATQDGMDKIMLALQGVKAKAGDALAGFFDEHKDTFVAGIEAVWSGFEWLSNNLPTVGVIIGGVTAAVAAFKIAAWSAKLATEGFTIATKLQAIAQGALNAVMNANPIGLIILAITALVAGFVYLWNNCEGFRNFWINLWEGIKNAASAASEWLKGVWTSITSAFSNAWNSITSFLSGVWQTIKNVVQVGIMAIKAIISGAFAIITLPFRFIWENCKDTIMAAWNAIKEKVTAALNAIKGVISNVWNAIKGVIVPIITAIVNFVKQRWENLKNNVLTVFNTVKSIVSTVWNAIKTSISNVVNGIRNTVSSIFDSIKAKVSNVFNGIKSIASSVWNGIKSAITTPINAAKDAVKAAIDKIKGFFNFNWSLPKLKLPHFSIDGKFSLNPPSVPKLKVDWYADGGILTQPTVFGAAGNTLLAGGEAGAEAVVPLAVLWDKLETMIRSVFNSASSTGGTPDEGLTATAGKLLTLDDFSLGSLADGTSVVIYYDFSGFTWSPQIQSNGRSDDEDDLMARLKAHEAEFFDWLEEFIKMREVAQYA